MNIAVIMLNYFGHADTIECVDSLSGHGLSRILIVDNSADETEATHLVQALGSRNSVDIATSGRNLGFAGGVNHGLRLLGLSAYDAFLLLNNDTLALPDTIQRLASGMEALDLDIASPLIRCYPETHRIWSAGNYYNRLTGMTGTVRTHGFRGDIPYLTGCCLLVRREVFDAVGLLDEDFFMYGEDVELCCRASKRGFRFGIVPDSVLYHKVSGSAGSNSPFYEYSMNLGHLLLCGKLAESASEKALSLSIKSLSLFSRAVLRSLRYGNPKAIIGYAQAIRRVALDLARQA